MAQEPVNRERVEGSRGPIDFAVALAGDWEFILEFTVDTDKL